MTLEIPIATLIFFLFVIALIGFTLGVLLMGMARIFEMQKERKIPN